MLRLFAHPVACCCAKFETGHTFSPVQTDATLLGVVARSLSVEQNDSLKNEPAPKLSPSALNQFLTRGSMDAYQIFFNKTQV